MAKYAKLERLYSGPFCDVYKGLGDDGEVVALKVVDFDFLRKPHDFKNEIRLMRQLKHPGISEYSESYKVGEDNYLVMKYYECTLADVMSRYLRRKMKFNLTDASKNTMTTINELPPEYARNIILGLIPGLQFIHSHGVIHRDIKPSNIFFVNIDDLLKPIIGDFGISYDCNKPPSDEPPSKKVIDIATGYYKAPELCFGVADYGVEVDLWALGIIMSQVYSRNCKPANYVEDTDGCDKTGELNDFVLIRGTFTAFGTPTITDQESELYFPRLAHEDSSFTKMQYKEMPRKPMADLLPRCDKEDERVLFENLTRYSGRTLS